MNSKELRAWIEASRLRAQERLRRRLAALQKKN